MKNIGVVICITVLLVFLSSIRFVSSDFTKEQSLFGAFLIVLNAVLWLGCVPFLIIRYVWKERVVDFGFRVPESWGRASILTFLCVSVFVPIILVSATNNVFREFYSLAGIGIFRFLLFGVILPLIYYFAEEFLFRGFLFFSLWKKIGWHSIWVSNILFALLHVSKPSLEIVFAFIAGIAFSYLSLKTRSFIPAAIAHAVLAITLNVLVTFVFPVSGVVPALHF